MTPDLRNAPYRPISEGETYRNAWNDYRRRSRTSSIAFVVSVSALLAMTMPARDTVGSRLATTIAVIGLVGYAFAALRFEMFRCPGCGGRFSRKRTSWPTFRPAACSDCGIRAGDEPA